jgi:phosphoribosyl-ATP pyrophosphohydrolase/phosphoribosyl-AMP cyclohydrolase
MTEISELRWNEQGLLPAVVQDVTTGQVLMLAWMNEEALRLTLLTGETHFWSRSRQRLWHKGARSGNIQQVASVQYDCDGDALLVKAWPHGPACHTGETSCFYREFTLEKSKADTRGLLSAEPVLEWSPEAAEGADPATFDMEQNTGD